MPTYREAAALRIAMGAPVVALVVFLFTDFGLNSVRGTGEGTRSGLRPALEQIESQTRIPILLPFKLPSAIPERDIKLASGSVPDGGYFISRKWKRSNFAAGFSGSTRDLPNTHRVALSGGRTGMFRRVRAEDLVHQQTYGGSRTA
jgi:hypothetical protein